MVQEKRYHTKTENCMHMLVTRTWQC